MAQGQGYGCELYGGGAEELGEDFGSILRTMNNACDEDFFFDDTIKNKIFAFHQHSQIGR